MGGGCRVFEPELLTSATVVLSGLSLLLGAWWRQQPSGLRGGLALGTVGLTLGAVGSQTMGWIELFEAGLWGGSPDYCARPAWTRLLSLRMHLELLAVSLGGLGVAAAALSPSRSQGISPGRGGLSALLLLAGAACGAPHVGAAAAGCALLLGGPRQEPGATMLGVLAALGLVSGLVLWDFSALLGGVAEELAAAHRHYYREEALASLATGGAVSRLGLGLGLTAALSMLSKPGTREEVLSIVLVLIGSFGMLAVAGTLHRIESGMAFLSGPFAPDSRMLAELREGITVPTSPDGMSIWQEHQVDLEDEPAGDPGEVLWIADQDTPLSTIEARFSAALQERGALSVYFLVRLAPLHEGQDSLHLSCTEGWQPSPEAPLSTLLSAGRTVQVRCEP